MDKGANLNQTVVWKYGGVGGYIDDGGNAGDSAATAEVFGFGGNGGRSGTRGHYCFGGGGYYGGGAVEPSSSNYGGAGGGSGYCNTSKFTCSGSNGQRSGNGRVVISW